MKRYKNSLYAGGYADDHDANMSFSSSLHAVKVRIMTWNGVYPEFLTGI